MTLLVSMVVITSILTSNVFAAGDLPVYSTKPSINELTNSPVYLTTSTLGKMYFGASSDCDYFYYSNGTNLIVMFPTYTTMYYTLNSSVVEQSSSRESSGQRRYYTAYYYSADVYDENSPRYGIFVSIKYEYPPL